MLSFGFPLERAYGKPQFPSLGCWGPDESQSTRSATWPPLLCYRSTNCDPEVIKKQNHTSRQAWGKTPGAPPQSALLGCC